MKPISLPIVALATTCIVAVSAPAFAVTITTDYGTWLAGPGVSGRALSTTMYAPTATTDISSPVLVSDVSLNGGGSLTTNIPVEVDQVGSPLWLTWSGGYSGQVLYSGDGVYSIELALTGLHAFGFEVEPLDYNTYTVSVLLSSGQTTSQDINGNSGAAFFGYYGRGVTGLTISTTSEPFAFGNFSSVAVPLPAALPLFGTAIGGLGLIGWRRRRAKAAA